tara:strand:- start:1101 stop:1907 length:807 start_codon:yes stop_codon:yes gene_type:complete
MKAIITNEERDALDDSLQSHYSPIEDGKHLLNVDPVDGFALENVEGLKSSLSKERGNTRDTLSALKAFEGLDAAEARAAIEKASEMDGWTPQDKVAEQIARREKQLIAKYDKDSKEMGESNAHLTSQLEKHLVEASAITALTKHKGSVELLLPHVKSSTRVERDGSGNFVARIVDRDGHPRISMKTGSQEPMSIDELVEGMKSNDTFAPAFAGSGATGSGSAGNRTGSAVNGRHVLSFEDSRDPVKYRMAKQRADAAGSQLEIQSNNR